MCGAGGWEGVWGSTRDKRYGCAGCPGIQKSKTAARHCSTPPSINAPLNDGCLLLPRPKVTVSLLRNRDVHVGVVLQNNA